MSDTVTITVTLGTWYLRLFRPVVLRVLDGYAPEHARKHPRYHHPSHRQTSSVTKVVVQRQHAQDAREAVWEALRASLAPRHHRALRDVSVEVEEPLALTYGATVTLAQEGAP